MENLDASKNYNDKSGYNFLQQSETTQHIIADDNLVFWHKDVLLKVNLFVCVSFSTAFQRKTICSSNE